jgi:hypothetical protein
MFAGCSTACSSAQHKALEKMNRQDYDKTVYTVLSALPVTACSARAEYLLKRGSFPAVVCCPLYVGIA